MAKELFESAVRGQEDLGGVFEYDGNTAHFYLYDMRQINQQIVDTIHIFSGTTDLNDSDVIVQWDKGEQRVGLFLRDVQWAVFNVASRRKYGGNYKTQNRPEIPNEEIFSCMS
ncbi:MAG: DUF2251 domain-containing protein [Nitrospira sp.]|nr:MAG: DUF2251 domain-containing protein [Nitrospira sp.]